MKKEYNKICLFCKNSFIAESNKRKFCSHKCANSYITDERKERLRKNYYSAWEGNGVPDYVKEKIRQAHLDKKLSKKHKRKISEGNKGKKRTLQQRINMSNGQRGEKGSNWQGGLTKLHKRIKGSYKWYEWRRLVFERDNYTCQKCYSENCIIHPHHMHPFEFSKIIRYLKDKHGIEKLQDTIMEYEPLWNIDIGITLCKKCHKLTDSYAKNN